MYYADFHKEGYSESYVTARNQIDMLCDLIVSGDIPRQRAEDEYDKIEAQYSRENPEMIEFFRTIYKGRIERLAMQFPPEKK